MTVAQLFLVHTGNLTSDITREHLPTAAKYEQNRKLWKNFPLVQFLTTSSTQNLYLYIPISHFITVLLKIRAVTLSYTHFPVSNTFLVFLANTFLNKLS